MAPSLLGTLSVTSAAIDFRTEKARVRAIFSGPDFALEVEYDAVLNAELLNALDNGFRKAGLPLISTHPQPPNPKTPKSIALADDEPRDRRTREWREWYAQKATNSNNGDDVRLENNTEA